MSALLLNESTEAELKAFLMKPAQSVLIAGEPGSGRFSTASWITQELLGVQKLAEGLAFKQIVPDETDKIGIEQMRELNRFLDLKSVSPVRVVLISEADKMSIAAQNSFLKLLEEPPAGTVIIMTGQANRLRPTILSRVQRINLRPVSSAEAVKYFARASFARQDINQAYLIAGGKIGLIASILADDAHPLLQASRLARQALTGTAYDRLLLVNDLAKDKVAAKNLLVILGQMAKLALNKANGKMAPKRWQRIMKVCYLADEALSRNANAKLILTDFALNL